MQGGRTSMDLKDTPAAVSIINQQFLEDNALTDIYQAEIWAVNTNPTYDPGNATTGSNPRGPNFSFFSRNYFLWYIKSDSYNTERFEFGRGPNGVLFGDGNIGGLATTMTKQAYLGKPASISVAARVDSYGGHRESADISVPAGDRFALRLNLLHDRGTMWEDRSNQFRDGAHLAGTVKLFDKTNFRFEGELGKIDRQIYITAYAENASYWDRTTVYNGTTALNTAVGGPGVARVSTGSTYFVDIPGNPAVSYGNWATFYRSTGSGFSMRDSVRSDLPVPLPLLDRRERNNMPGDSRYLLKYATSTFYLDHRFNDDLFGQVAFYTQRSPYEPEISDSGLNQYYIDVNTVMPNGAPNPNFGKPYSENTLNKTYQLNTVTELRGLVAYRFDTKWWKANLNTIFGTRFDKFDYSQRRLVQTNGTNPAPAAAENEYHFREYWDNLVDFGTPNIPGRTFDYARYTNLIHQRKFDDYAQLVLINKFFHDKLTLILGGRIDKVYQTQVNKIQNNENHDPVTGLPVMGATYIPEGETKARTVIGGKSVVDLPTSNKNAGLVYYVRPWLGLYYNYSEAFSTPDAGNNLIDGSQPPVSKSNTNEWGFKLNLMDGKVYADVRYYDSKQVDSVTSTGSATQINNIWTQLGRTDLNGLAYRDTQALVLDGYEFEMTANPTKNWRLMANYSLPNAQMNADALPGLRGYYSEHIAEWKVAAATNSTVQTNLDAIDALLKTNSAFALKDGFTKYRANIYATYTFRGGALDGLAVGAGGNYVGPAKVGAGATAFDYLWTEPFYLVSAHASFTTKLYGKVVKWQLNVKNLLDERDLVTRNFGGYRQNGVSANPIFYAPNVLRYNDPRQFILSASVKF
jgi:outer membrane receptor protein involved in Fe transport